MKKVLIINGSGGVGKDTLVNLMGKYVPTAHISIVDHPKQVAKNAGWDGTKDEKGRKLLSDIKLAIEAYNDGNYRYIAQEVEDFQTERTNKYKGVQLLCIDMREAPDISRAKADFGAESVLVKNPKVPHITSNIADRGVFDIDYDYTIHNDGTLEDLEYAAKVFAEDMVSGEYEPPREIRASQIPHTNLTVDGNVLVPPEMRDIIAATLAADNADERCEILAERILHEIDTDEEALDKKGRAILKALLDNDAPALLMAMCGWTIKYLMSSTFLMRNDPNSYDIDKGSALFCVEDAYKLSCTPCIIDPNTLEVTDIDWSKVCESEDIYDVFVDMDGKRYAVVPESERKDSITLWYQEPNTKGE